MKGRSCENKVFYRIKRGSSPFRKYCTTQNDNYFGKKERLSLSMGGSIREKQILHAKLLNTLELFH